MRRAKSTQESGAHSDHQAGHQLRPCQEAGDDLNATLHHDGMVTEILFQPTERILQTHSLQTWQSALQRHFDDPIAQLFQGLGPSPLLLAPALRGDQRELLGESQAAAERRPELRVQDHRPWAPPHRQAHREPRVILQQGVHPNQDGVVHGPQGVRHLEALGAAQNEPLLLFLPGHTAIKALGVGQRHGRQAAGPQHAPRRQKPGSHEAQHLRGAAPGLQWRRMCLPYETAFIIIIIIILLLLLSFTWIIMYVFRFIRIYSNTIHDAYVEWAWRGRKEKPSQVAHSRGRIIKLRMRSAV